MPKFEFQKNKWLMKFKFKQDGYEEKECDVEIFKNKSGLVVKFYNKEIEPDENKISDYVYVDAGYGYLSLKRKGEDGILSGFLNKEFFSNTSIILQVRDFVKLLDPQIEDAYVPYNFERIQKFDSLTWTGETYDELKKEESKTTDNNK